jgi:type IV pilus assembly protein PilA
MKPMNNLKERKLNNNGFSLVELIIVIAIMAVLIGVLAPQYLKYVEKSRQSADLDNYQTIITAVQVYYADPSNALPSAGSYNLTVSDKGVVTADDPITKACTDAGTDVTKITMKSTAYGKTQTIVFTVTAKGLSGFSTSNSDLATALSISQTAVADPTS